MRQTDLFFLESLGLVLTTLAENRRVNRWQIRSTQTFGQKSVHLVLRNRSAAARTCAAGGSHWWRTSRARGSATHSTLNQLQKASITSHRTRSTASAANFHSANVMRPRGGELDWLGSDEACGQIL
jgi:hypothetical protein